MSETNNEARRRERIALVASAWAASALILWLVRPVGMGVLLGVLFAVTFRPAYERVAQHRSPSVAALVTVLASTLAVAFTFGALVWVLVHDGMIVAREAIQSATMRDAAHGALVALGRLTSQIGISSDELGAKIRTFAEDSAVRAAGVVHDTASATASLALALFFLMLTMYFVLRRWEQISTGLQETLPLRPDYTLKLLQEFGRVGRTTLLSTVFIGLLKGVLAAVGYAIAGLPRPLFFGVLTAIASLLPGVGTMLVWVPAGVALLLVHRIAGGTFLLLWGVVAVTAIPTYVIRPRLAGRGGSVPALFTFIALFGGAAVFGLKGLILGPVLMAVAVATLRLYAEEERSWKHITA